MADLPLSRLDDDEKVLVSRLAAKARKDDKRLTLLERYRDGEQRLKQIGMAVPPELRMFETVVNVAGMAVREPVARQDLRGFQRSADDRIDVGLQEAWESNNLDAQSVLVHADCRTFGRAFVSVSSNAEDSERPLITAESPLGMAVMVNRARRRIDAAFRSWREDGVRGVTRGTLYRPHATLHLVRGSSGWVVEDRDDHKAGFVPVVMFLNRQWQDRWAGRSEMSDVIGMTDAIARMVTNMQMAGETVAIPHRWAAGVEDKEFFDQNGKPLPAWEAYMTVLRATSNANAKFGAFPTADLDNFNKAVNNMLAWCGMVLGLPTRYMGQDTVNPAAEGAIIADEIRLIKNVELMNRFDGASWSWSMGMHEFFRTGEMPGRNDIRALWFNPATPTYSQRAEAVFKLTTGDRPILSREGAWEEMGWSEARKAKERANLAAEASADPALRAAIAVLNGTGGAAA